MGSNTAQTNRTAAIKDFVNFWLHEGEGKEDSEAKTFWDSFVSQVLGGDFKRLVKYEGAVSLCRAH